MVLVKLRHIRLINLYPRVTGDSASQIFKSQWLCNCRRQACHLSTDVSPTQQVRHLLPGGRLILPVTWFVRKFIACFITCLILKHFVRHTYQ